jgi:hypothetical protein
LFGYFLKFIILEDFYGVKVSYEGGWYLEGILWILLEWYGVFSRTTGYLIDNGGGI